MRWSYVIEDIPRSRNRFCSNINKNIYLMNEHDVYAEILSEHDFIKSKIVGIGSGRTVKRFLQNIPLQKRSNLLCVPTSYDTKMELIRLGFKLIDMEQAAAGTIDVAIDGFDSIFGNVAIKGGGGCMTWEKLVALQAKMLILIGGEDKLGKIVQVPVELIPIAWPYVQTQIQNIYGKKDVVKLREGSGKLGPVVTDFGNWIIDIPITKDIELRDLHDKLKGITGVVETGIFTLPFELKTFQIIAEE